MGNLLTINNVDNLSTETPNMYRIKTNNKVQFLFESKFNNIINNPFPASTPDRLIYLETQVGVTCRQTAQEKYGSRTRYEIDGNSWSSWADDAKIQTTPLVNDLNQLLKTQGLNINDTNQYPLILNGGSTNGTINKWGINIPVNGNSMIIQPRTKDDSAWIPNSSLVLSNDTNSMAINGYLSNIIQSGLLFNSNISSGYLFSASSEMNPAFKAFNKEIETMGGWSSNNFTYNTTGIYNGYVATQSSSLQTSKGSVYKGEWLQIKLPKAWILTGYGLVSVGIPQSWCVLASNDGSNWITIDVQTSDNADFNVEKIFYIKQNFIPFSYYRIVFRKFSTTTSISLKQFNLYTNNSISVNNTSFFNGDITIPNRICIGNTCVTESDFKKVLLLPALPPITTPTPKLVTLKVNYFESEEGMQTKIENIKNSAAKVWKIPVEQIVVNLLLV